MWDLNLKEAFTRKRWSDRSTRNRVKLLEALFGSSEAGGSRYDDLTAKIVSSVTLWRD